MVATKIYFPLLRKDDNMSPNNKYIAIIILLVCGVIFMYLIKTDEPLALIERKLNVKLPSSSEVINYQYYRNYGSFGAKILIASKDVEDIKKQLNGFFKRESPEKAAKKLPNFRNVYSWWDLDKQSIEAYYFTFVSGEKTWLGYYSPKTRDVWAFISKNKNGQHYLYISY